MKTWKTPELFDLRTEWTQNDLRHPGNDSYAEHVELEDGTILNPGSC